MKFETDNRKVTQVSEKGFSLEIDATEIKD